MGRLRATRDHGRHHADRDDATPVRALLPHRVIAPRHRRGYLHEHVGALSVHALRVTAEEEVGR